MMKERFEQRLFRIFAQAGYSPVQLLTITPEEMVEVARIHKDVLSRYGMDTRTCKTMCLECGCCDLVPFRDL